MAVIKTVRMICSNIDGNNNKFWNADLHDDGNVFVLYGRVGYAGQSEGPFPGGQAFLDKKIKEKKKKGYIEFDGIAMESSKTTVSVVPDVKEVAKRQIQFSSPQLEKLIERLAASNIHNITSSTKITYDVNTGLFSTPLGIVTPASIDEARNLLALIKAQKENGKDEHFGPAINRYLMLIPHDFGMTKVQHFVDSMDFMQELNTLDSLEASYTSFTTSVKESKVDKTIEEQIFNVKLDTLDNGHPDFKEIDKWFENSKRKAHGYDNVRIKNAYIVDIKDNSDSFEKSGKVLGNITRVFHGTSEANLLSILKSGMKVSPPSTAYIAGKMWGNGCYFAIHSSKALGYTLGRWGNTVHKSGWIFVCDIAMGNIDYPKNTCHKPKTGCDSIWATPANTGLFHDELIVYDNSQINIKFLLETTT